MSRFVKILLLVICICAIVFCTVIAADLEEPEIVVSDDPLSFEEDALKLGDTITLTGFHDNSITVEYSYTENYSSTPLALRSDAYGTYEVYVDVDGNEYYFLTDTELLCGYLAFFHYEDVPAEQAITEANCLAIAQSFITNRLQTNAITFQNIALSSIKYIENEGIFDLHYNYYIGAYKTDDELDIWIDHNGDVVSFTQLNRNRYSSVTINASDYTEADEYIDSVLSGSSLTNYDIIDTYVTINDTGDLLLVKVIEYSNGEYSELEMISHEIG